jgi:polysaccharide deacetylase family protein (PEP-CTERM system associated)
VRSRDMQAEPVASHVERPVGPAESRGLPGVDVPPVSLTGDRVMNAMTVDVEDYFHVSVFDGVVPRSAWNTLESRVCRNTERLLEIFAEHDVKGTFFVLGWVAERFPELLRRIAEAGHEVASHGYGHRLVYDQTPRAFREDVRRAKRLLEDAAVAPVRGYRAPSYSIVPRSLWALDVLIEEGYEYDSSIFPIRHDRYGIPVSARHPYLIERDAGRIIEAPASTARLAGMNLPVGGGGYFRLLPYAWTRWGVERVNRIEGRAAIFYLHPWEIDPDQPRLRAGLIGRLRHYRNLAETELRLRKLLRDFSWGPLRELLAAYAGGSAASETRFALPYLW